MENFDYKKFKSYYFVGIGGVSVSSLAIYLHENGYTVKGADVSQNSYVKKLKDLNITVYDSHKKQNILGADVVVYSSAIDFSNEELSQAQCENVPVVNRTVLLNSILNDYKNVIAISGTHGKTTTTALMTEVFNCYFNPTAFIGGESISYGNLLIGEKDFCITEACEYKKNLLNLSPTVSIILNADYDHVDCYKNLNEVIDTFSNFALNTICIKNADDINLKNISAKYTFGIENTADFMAKNIKTTPNGVSFYLYVNKKRTCKIHTPLYGKHNVLNVLSVIATATSFNLPLSKIKTAISNFKGVKRRNEFLGNKHGSLYFADYAHHPKEIENALCLPTYKGKKTLFIFEPHTYTRTKVLINDFVKVFSKTKNLVIYKTYPARETFDVDGDAFTLTTKINSIKRKNQALYFDDVFKLLVYAQNFDKVVILGAGRLYDDIKRFLT